MSASFTVFVCSTFNDLEQEREGVLDAIRHVQSRHNAMEFFGVRPGRPIEVSLEEVRKSDLLVVIVGAKYGSLAPELGISYSQAEYEEGARLGKPCLVYLRDDHVPILAKYVERDPEKLKLLEAWKQTLNAKHTVAKFENWPQLAVQVAADLGNFLLVRATAEARGVAEAPLREVLKRLGEAEVAEAEIPDRLAKAADELLRLRTDLDRLRNDRPEFAAIRARASALIEMGDFDAARAALNDGRQRARALREESSRIEAGFLADEARSDRLQQNYDAACAKFAEAARLDPDNVGLWIELGDLWVVRGSLTEAAKAYFAARDAAAKTGNDRNLSVSYIKIGDMQVAQGDLAGALKSFRDGLAIADRLVKSDLGNAGWQRDLSVSYIKIGEVQVAQGDLAGALKSFRDSLAIRDRLAKSDPGIAGWQYDLGISNERIGDVQVAQGDLAGALACYRDSLAIIDRLAKSDPGNAGWQRDLSVSYEKIGNVQLWQGDLVGSLKSYRDGLVIAERLARSDPGNAGWQRDLSVSYNRIGGVHLAQGDLADALKSFRDSLAIAERLARSDPGNAGWQRDLSVSYQKIGDVQVAQDDLKGALTSYRDSFVIQDRLTKADPTNLRWRRDLSVTLNKLGDAQLARGEIADALASYLDSFVIRERLTKIDSDNTDWPSDLAALHSKILSALGNSNSSSSNSLDLFNRLGLISREKGSIFASLAISDTIESTRLATNKISLEFSRFQNEIAQRIFTANLLSRFKIRAFELHQSLIFDDIYWNLSDNVNILLGRNGFGKTLLLRLMTGMLTQDDEKLTSLLAHSPDDQLLTLRVLRNDDATPIIRDKLSFAQSAGKIPILAISDSRFVNRGRQGFGSEDDDNANPAQNGARHFLYDLPFEARLQTVFAQMCIEYINVRGGKGDTQIRPSTPQLDLIATVIQELSGESFEFYRIEPIGSARFSMEVLTDASPGKPIAFQHASQGTLSVVAIFALIYQFLKAVHTEVAESELCTQPGIVIIDEVDAHLHPAWQRRIVELLRERFPKIQFVLTAHSPLVVAGCRQGEVAVLRRNNSNLEVKHIPRDFAGVSPEEIYRQVFEIEDKDVRFLELHARIPQLRELREDLETKKRQENGDVSELEEAIRAIERTKEQRGVAIDYETLQQENQQLRRQLGAVRRETTGKADK